MTKEDIREKLLKLIPQYALNNSELKDYEKLVEIDKTVIKDLMAKLEESKFETTDYVATVTVQHKTSIDEDMLLDLLHSHNYTSVIKTREYVDMDELENAIYHNQIDKETLLAMKECESVKNVPVLKVTRRKK